MIRTAAFLTALLAAAPAVAGGIAPTPPAPVYVEVTPDSDWTEFYIGLQGEIVNGDIAGNEFDGTLYGGFAGYRYDLGDITIGAEIDYMVGEFDFGTFPFADNVVSLTYDATLLRIGGEIGYDMGDFLPYLTAGYADLELEIAGLSASDNGFFYGIGADYRVSEQVTIGAELLQHEFDDFNSSGNNLSFTTFGINVAFTF